MTRQSEGDTVPLFEAGAPLGTDNVTDWALAEFREAYSDTTITKDEIWEYLYGVMHAPDWRERYRNDLRKSLPRIPLAANFEDFRAAGRELMALHVGFETCPEAEVAVVVGEESEATKLTDSAATSDAEVFHVEKKMRLLRDESSGDYVLHVNSRCRLVGIPPEALEYQVSGRSPLEWAADSLVRKVDSKSGIEDDPNSWHLWAGEPFELIRHLRRLVYIGLRTAEIVRSLPPSLDGPRGVVLSSEEASAGPGES